MDRLWLLLTWNFKFSSSVIYWEQDNPIAKRERRLVVDTKRVAYIGTNYGEDGRDASQYLFGIHNKATGEVKLVPVSHVYRMKQEIKGYRSNIEKNRFAGLPGTSSLRVSCNDFVPKLFRHRVSTPAN